MSLRLAILALGMAAVAHAASDGLEWRSSGSGMDPAAVAQDLGQGYRFEHHSISARDGAKLATTVFLPPGEGPWSTVLIRTPYGRGPATRLLKTFTRKGPYACVVQDVRGTGGSRGAPVDPYSSWNEVADGYDTIEWVVGQRWSNGRVGMTGGSGHGIAAAMAFYCGHPALKVVQPMNSAGDFARHWAFENGVRKHVYDWATHRGARFAEWPRPTLPSLERQAAPDIPATVPVYIGDDGWYNIFGDAGIEFFERNARRAVVFMEVSPRAHGKQPAGAIVFRSSSRTAVPEKPDFLDVLDGRVSPGRSVLVYAVLNAGTGAAERKVTEKWPPDGQTLCLHLGERGILRLKPQDAKRTLTYVHDPANPVPSVGGAWSFGVDDPVGAQDQRALSGRADVLRFATEPLSEPVEIAGRVEADLLVSSDAPDSTFILKLVDVLPDGREILLRETAFLARFRDGMERPLPMPRDEPVRIRIRCNSIAARFEQGHRIGVLISSSSFPAYEVHPNVWEPVADSTLMRIAHHQVHIGGPEGSRILLPVVTGN